MQEAKPTGLEGGADVSAAAVGDISPPPSMSGTAGPSSHRKPGRSETPTKGATQQHRGTPARSPAETGCQALKYISVDFERCFHEGSS